jgi:hypothetical protein
LAARADISWWNNGNSSTGFDIDLAIPENPQNRASITVEAKQ